MKKILSAVALFICVAALVGCTSSNTSTDKSNNTETANSMVESVNLADANAIAEGTEKVTYSTTTEDGRTIKYILYSKDGKVTNEQVETTRPYTFYEVATVEEAKTLAEEEMQEFKDLYSGKNGFLYEVTTSGDNIVDTMKVNYLDGDVEQLKEIPDVCLVEDTSNGVDLAEFETALTNEGYTKEAT